MVEVERRRCTPFFEAFIWKSRDMSRDCRERVTKGNLLDSRGSVEYSESYLVFYSFILSCLICLFISKVHCYIITFAYRDKYFISGLNFDTKLRREFSYFILFYCSHIFS